MTTQFAQDLRLARKIAGLTQHDCATLMNSRRKQIRYLETGTKVPSLDDLFMLSVIYNRTFEDHFAERMRAARATVRAGLPQLPVSAGPKMLARQRQFTLDRIEADLLREPNPHGD